MRLTEKTEKKKLTEIKGTRRDREAKHDARAQQIQRGRSKMFGTAKQSNLRDCIKGTEWHGHDETPAFDKSPKPSSHK